MADRLGIPMSTNRYDLCGRECARLVVMAIVANERSVDMPVDRQAWAERHKNEATIQTHPALSDNTKFKMTHLDTMAGHRVCDPVNSCKTRRSGLARATEADNNISETPRPTWSSPGRKLITDAYSHVSQVLESKWSKVDLILWRGWIPGPFANSCPEKKKVNDELHNCYGGLGTTWILTDTTEPDPNLKKQELLNSNRYRRGGWNFMEIQCCAKPFPIFVTLTLATWSRIECHACSYR